MKILLVEDSDHDAQLIFTYLGDTRFCVDRVEQMGDAINGKDDYDTILVDLKLPNSHGAESIKQISERFPEIPIIMITGDARRETILEAHANGARDYIVKHKLDQSRLLRALKDAMEVVTDFRTLQRAERSLNFLGAS